MIYAPEASDAELCASEFMARFNDLLTKELDRRHIPHEGVELRDIGGTNLDVYIWISRKAVEYDFKYIGWGYLRRRKLREVTLPEYIAKYASSYLRELRSWYEHQLAETTKQLGWDNWTEQHKQFLQKQHDLAKEVTDALAKVVD